MASGSYRVRWTIDEQKLFDGIFNKLDAVLQSDGFKYEKNALLAEFCDPYVPYKTGALSTNVAINTTGVTYLQPYASIQYRTIFQNYTREFHPLATHHWRSAMMRDRRDEFLGELGRLIAEYSYYGEQES